MAELGDPQPPSAQVRSELTNINFARSRVRSLATNKRGPNSQAKPLAVPAIAGQLGCHPKKVRRWLHRFSAEGIDGLGDRPGAGRKRRITEAQRSAIIALARSGPPGRLARDGAGELSAEDEDGAAQWTLDTLAQAARDAGIRIGRSQVRRILLAEKVRWRRTRSWATSTDPDFAPKGPASWSSIPPRRRAPR